MTQNGSLDAQGHIIERWRNNLNFCGDVEYQITEWIEEEQSAFRDKNLKRKELLRLMEKIQSRRIDFIVFESLSRLFRSVKFAIEFFELASKYNVEIWEAEYNTNFSDFDDPRSYDAFISRAVQSEVESMTTSKRVLMKHREAMVNVGKDPSPQASILGLDLHPHRIGIYLVNKSELEIVIDIMKAFVRFKNYSETLDYCHALNYKTKTYEIKKKIEKDGTITPPRIVQGKSFDQAALKALFRNPRYGGKSTFDDSKKNQFRHLQDENGKVTWTYSHGQVIDQALLDEVEATMKIAGFKKRPRKKTTRDFSLLADLIIDSQGQTYHCQSAKNHQYRYYFNPNNGHRFSMKEFDSKFINLLDSYKNRSSVIESVLNDYALKLQGEVATYVRLVSDIALS